MQQKKIRISSFSLKYFRHFPRKGGYMEEKHEEIKCINLFCGTDCFNCLLCGKSGDNNNEAGLIHIF